MEGINQQKLEAEKEKLHQIAAQLHALTEQAYHRNEDGTFDYVPKDNEKPLIPLDHVLHDVAVKNNAYSLDLMDIRNPQTQQFILDAVGKKLNDLGFQDEFAFLGAGTESIALTARHENNSIYRIVIKLTPKASAEPSDDTPFAVKPFYDEVVGEHENIGKLRLSISPMMLVLNKEDYINLAQPMMEIMGLGLRKYNLERQKHFHESPQLLLSDNEINNWGIPPVVKNADGALEIAPVSIDAGAIRKNQRQYQHLSGDRIAEIGEDFMVFPETAKQTELAIQNNTGAAIPCCDWHPAQTQCRPRYFSQFRIPEQLIEHLTSKARETYDKATVPAVRTHALNLGHYVGFGHAITPAALNQWLTPDQVLHTKIRSGANWRAKQGDGGWRTLDPNTHQQGIGR